MKCCMNEPVVLQAGIAGKGTFAARSYTVGEPVLLRRNYMSLRYVNHSCEPNCVILPVGHMESLFAKKPIAVGEEITMDYARLPFEHKTPEFKCQCGSKQCRGTWKNERLGSGMEP